MVNRGAQCRPECWPLHSGTGRRVVPVRLPIPLFNTFTTPASHADTGDTAAQHRRPGVRKSGSRRIQTNSAVDTARSDCDRSVRTTERVDDFLTAPLPRSAGSFGWYSSTAPVMLWARVCSADSHSHKVPESGFMYGQGTCAVSHILAESIDTNRRSRRQFCTQPDMRTLPSQEPW